jgi:hypothetical protein
MRFLHVTIDKFRLSVTRLKAAALLASAGAVDKKSTRWVVIAHRDGRQKRPKGVWLLDRGAF